MNYTPPSHAGRMAYRPKPGTPSLGPLMLSLTGFMLGASLWFAAFGIHIWSVILQPSDLVIIAGYPILLAYWKRLGPAGVLVLLTSLVIFFAALLNDGDAIFFLFYLTLLLPFCFLLYIIVQDQHAGWRFLQGFTVGGCLTIVHFLAQTYFGPASLDFRTNTNFTLPAYSRGYGLLPEVSTLVTYFIYLLCITLTMVRLGARYIFRPAGNTLFLALLTLACMLITASSSVIVILPVILVIILVHTQRISMRNIFLLVLALPALALILNYYFQEYYFQIRGSAGLASLRIRFTTFMAGLSVLSSGEVFGVGLGNNHLITERIYRAASELGVQNYTFVPDGVNSLVIQRIFEEGYMGLMQIALLIYLFITAHLRLLRAREDTVGKILLMVATASFITSTIASGYRGIYMNWFWMVIPAALLDSRVRKIVEQTRAVIKPASLSQPAKTPLRLTSSLVPSVARLPRFSSDQS